MRLLILLYILCCPFIMDAQKATKQFTLHVGYGYTPYESMKSETVDFKVKDGWNNFINIVNGVKIKNPVGDDVGFDIDTLINENITLVETFNYSVGAEFTVGIKMFELSLGAFTGKYGNLPRFNTSVRLNPLTFIGKPVQDRSLSFVYRLETDLSTPTVDNFNSKQIGVISDWKIWVDKKDNIGFILSIEVLKDLSLQGAKSHDSIFTKIKFNF